MNLRIACLALLLLAVATPALAAHALALDVQRYAVDRGRTVRAATGVVVVAGERGDASVSLARIADSFDGDGWAFGAGGAVRVAPGALLRGGVTRVARTAALDAWSARLGPEFHAGATTLGVAALGGRREDGAWTKGAALELEQALSPRTAARLCGTYARTDGEPDAAAAALGARWNAFGPLHLTGELGLARDPANALAPSSLPLASPPANAARMSGRIGMRIVLP